MLVAVCFVGGWGHVEPLLPLARLARAAGHEVIVAGQRAVLPAVRALGFDTVVLGPDTLSGAIRPLVSVDRRAEEALLRDRFVARYGPMRAATLLS